MWRSKKSEVASDGFSIRGRADPGIQIDRRATREGMGLWGVRGTGSAVQFVKRGRDDEQGCEIARTTLVRCGLTLATLTGASKKTPKRQSRVLRAPFGVGQERRTLFKGVAQERL